MSCCGQKRRALRTQSFQPEAAHPRSTLENPTPLIYLGASDFVTKGEATGLTYLFSGNEVLSVDARDAPAFIASGIFSRPHQSPSTS
jgi:hypothetical protein